MNFGFLSTLDNLLLPYTIKNAKNHGIKNIFVFLDEKGTSQKDKKIFQKRTQGRFGDDIKPHDYLQELSNLNVPFYFVENHNSDRAIELYSLLKIDCLINAGTPRKISSKLLNKKNIPQGVLNIHPGKLPEYRGCSAVEWAIHNDDQIFNTVHYMEEDYDTGPLIKTEPYEFASNSTYVDIRSEVYLKGINLLCTVVKSLQNKTFSYKDAKKQNNLKAQYWAPTPEKLEDSIIEKANNKKYTYQNLSKLMTNIYDLIYVGTGPIMMLDALNNSENSNQKILIVDKENELGGSWKNIELFGKNFVENAVHYLLPSQKGYDFLAKNFNIKFENANKKFYALKIFNFKFMVSVNNIFGNIFYLINGGDQGEPITFKFLLNVLFNKSKVRYTKYPKEGMFHVVKRISDKLVKSKVKMKLNENVERITISENYITLKTNKNTYQTKKLMLSHGFIPCEIIGKDGKKILIEKKINQRPSLHIITKSNSKVSKKYFAFSQVLFPKGSLIKYVHQISQYQNNFEKKNQQIIVAALRHDLKKSKKNYFKIADLLEKYNCIPYSAKRSIFHFYWQDILIPQITTEDLLKISKISGNMISFLETECLNTGLGKYSDSWNFYKNYFYD